MTAETIPLPDALLLEWDRDRERSQQLDLGMSAIGGCRRKAGYIWHRVPPSDPGGSIQAVLGTLIHVGLAEQARKRLGDTALIEVEVFYGGIRGHADLYHDGTVLDWKSVSRPRYDQASTDGPDLNQTHQTALYAAALARAGFPVREIALDFIARDDGRVHRHVRPFRIEEVEEALRWLDNIRTRELDSLERDYRPGSPFCDGCAWFTECWGYGKPERSPLSVLFVDHPDAAYWLAQLQRGKDLKTEGGRLYDDARGALDALRPNDRGKSGPVIVDGPDGDLPALAWSVYDEERLDTKLVRADYKAVGAKPPVKRNEVVKMTVVPRPETDPREE